MEEMKAEVTAFRPIFRLLCCRRGLRKKFRGFRPRNLTPKKLSRAVKNLPVPANAILRGTDLASYLPIKWLYCSPSHELSTNHILAYHEESSRIFSIFSTCTCTRAHMTRRDATQCKGRTPCRGQDSKPDSWCAEWTPRGPSFTSFRPPHSAHPMGCRKTANVSNGTRGGSASPATTATAATAATAATTPAEVLTAVTTLAPTPAAVGPEAPVPEGGSRYCG